MTSPTRRDALRHFASWLAASPLLPAQAAAPSMRQMTNVFQLEHQAKAKLSPEVFALIAGGDRGGFERITIHQRLIHETTALDLSVNLFGATLFAPVVIGPVANQKRFHPEGEAATAQGALAGKALPVITGDTPFSGPHWRLDSAISPSMGDCKAIVASRPETAQGNASDWDWRSLDRLRKQTNLPLICKGASSVTLAQKAVQNGAAGIVVSNYRERGPSSIELLPKIVPAVNGKAVVLADGAFRRGTDILMALAFGASAVLVARPVMWGLAAFGADGVQFVMESLQTELGRNMVMSGRKNIGELEPSMLRIHKE